MTRNPRAACASKEKGGGGEAAAVYVSVARKEER